MKSKSVIAVVLAFVLITALITQPAGARDVTVKLDGKVLEGSVEARIENDVTYVPMRAIFEAFGMEVSWDNNTKTVTATDGTTSVTMTVGEKKITVNGVEKEITAAPIIRDDLTLVPARAVSESLDATVEWNGEKCEVDITSAGYLAQSEAWKENVGTIDLSTMTVSGEGAAVSGKVIEITKGGDFTVTGETQDAMIHVNTSERAKLRLSGMKLKNAAGPAIFFEQSDKSFITISADTENYVEDGAEYDVDAKAAIFSNDDIEIKGAGTLHVTSLAHHAIASDDDIKIEEGTLYITALEKDGIHANNTVKIQNGNITINSLSDGIQAEEDVVVEGGSLNITTTGIIEVDNSDRFGGFGGRRGGGMDGMGGMQPDGGAEPPEGTPNGDMQPPEGARPMQPVDGAQPPAGTQMQNAEVNTNAAKGIKAETDITVSGGTINISATDHAISSSGTIEISGGVINVSSEMKKGITADSGLTISGGEVTVSKATEGIESKGLLTISGGKIDVTASDDGINAGGTDGRDVAQGGAETGHDLLISGGEIYVNSSGDGLDANGRLLITGGTTVVDGPTNSGNGALDSGGVVKIDGGILLALGASGMAEGAGTDSAQPSFMYNLAESFGAGSAIAILDESGEIFSYTTKKSGNSIVFSSPRLEVGKKYTLSVDGAKYEIELTQKVQSFGAAGGGFGGGRGGFGGGMGGGSRRPDLTPLA